MKNMAAPALRFGMSEFTTMPWGFDQDVAEYARLGVEAIEVCEIKLDPEAGNAARQVARARDLGLTVSSVQPSVRTLFPSRSQPGPQDPAGRMARFRETITRLSRETPHVPFVTNTGPPPNGNVQEVLDVAAREYQALAAFAADHGVRVALEPLNPTILNVETALWTVAQARALIQSVDHPAFGLCLDYWNVWQNADVEAEIRACGDRIFVVQVSDWRTPRSFLDRLIPGTGAVPLPRLLRATHDAGYSGAYVVEIFSDGVPDALWAGDLARVVQDSRAGLAAAWAAAFA